MTTSDNQKRNQERDAEAHFDLGAILRWYFRGKWFITRNVCLFLGGAFFYSMIGGCGPT
jgi:uncharacterized protein involved in exopolysaccharide biosynthesis